MKVVRRSELDMASKKFDVVGIALKKRNKGDSLTSLADPCSLGELPSKQDMNNVVAIVCDVHNSNESPARTWELAVTVAFYYKVKIIYNINGVKYVAAPTSDENMLYTLMKTPGFYRNLRFLHSFEVGRSGLPEWTSYCDNVDVIDKLGIMQVGPEMPKLSMKWMKFHNDLYVSNKKIKDMEHNLMVLREDMAYNKVNIFYDSVHDNRLSRAIDAVCKDKFDSSAFFDIVKKLFLYVDGYANYAHYCDTREYKFYDDSDEDGNTEMIETLKWWLKPMSLTKKEKLEVIKLAKSWNKLPEIGQAWRDDIFNEIAEEIIEKRM